MEANQDDVTLGNPTDVTTSNRAEYIFKLHPTTSYINTDDSWPRPSVRVSSLEKEVDDGISSAFFALFDGTSPDTVESNVSIENSMALYVNLLGYFGADEYIDSVPLYSGASAIPAGSPVVSLALVNGGQITGDSVTFGGAEVDVNYRSGGDLAGTIQDATNSENNEWILVEVPCDL